MKLVIQRVSEASLEVDEKLICSIGKGLLVLIGIENDDEYNDADWLVAKTASMRIFEDQNGLMNLSIIDVNGEVLIISQFTLMASTKKGNRPSFIKAARPEHAIPLYEYFIQSIHSQYDIPVKTGIFGADMKVHLINEGPVTILIDSKKRE